MINKLQTPGDQYAVKISAATEEDLDQYKIFYVAPDRKRVRTRVRAGAVAFTKLSDAEREAARIVVGKKGCLPLPILTLWAPKESFFWVNPDRTKVMLRINLVGWSEMTIQERVEYYNALEMEKAFQKEEEKPYYNILGSVSGRISSSSPNLQHINDLRNSLPPGPQRNAVKNLAFGLTYGMPLPKMLTALKK